MAYTNDLRKDSLPPTSRIALAQTLQKCHLMLWQKKKNECTTNVFIMCLDFLCKVEYKSGKFIHAPTYTYNKVIRLLELVGAVKCE